MGCFMSPLLYVSLLCAPLWFKSLGCSKSEGLSHGRAKQGCISLMVSASTQWMATQSLCSSHYILENRNCLRYLRSDVTNYCIIEEYNIDILFSHLTFFSLKGTVYHVNMHLNRFYIEHSVDLNVFTQDSY